MGPPAVNASVSSPSGSAVRKIAIEVKIAHRHRYQHWPANTIPRSCKDEDSDSCDTTALQPGEQGFMVMDKGIQNGQRWIVGQFWRNNVSFLVYIPAARVLFGQAHRTLAEKIARAREIQAQMRPARDLAWCNASPNQLQAHSGFSVQSWNFLVIMDFVNYSPKVRPGTLQNPNGWPSDGYSVIYFRVYRNTIGNEVNETAGYVGSSETQPQTRFSRHAQAMRKHVVRDTRRRSHYDLAKRSNLDLATSLILVQSASNLRGAYAPEALVVAEQTMILLLGSYCNWTATGQPGSSESFFKLGDYQRQYLKQRMPRHPRRLDFLMAGNLSWIQRTSLRLGLTYQVTKMIMSIVEPPLDPRTTRNATRVYRPMASAIKINQGSLGFRDLSSFWTRTDKITLYSKD
ncbi:hypothetical protein QBC37DRAFT_404446 [Rhypophila decipiens]|uniref:Uncharacterized protein n=1 Tax=Rhypophila decipiens TaxID=261697 RepID=A0AAN7B396_9PEZI|nr:hypothetical protein QBC37DRAFT_404446 [Rhypophila decipiens]